MPAGLSSANGYEAWRIEFWSKKVAKSGPEGSLFGVWDGLGPLWRHLGGMVCSCMVPWGVWGPLWRHLGGMVCSLGGSLLDFGSPWYPFRVHLVTFGWPFGAKVYQK